jgi:hypothetical protein
MKVSLAAQVMSHTVAASLKALVATGKDYCSVSIIYCILLCKEWLMRIMRASLQSNYPQIPVVIKQTSLPSSRIS